MASSWAMLAGVNVIACACGEDTSAAGGLDDPIPCVCGRVWRLLIDLLRDQGQSAGEDAEAVAGVAAP